jgi:hypothetical protein
VELAGEWARVTASSRDRLEKSWILRWFEGFSNGAKLVGHALSPIRQAQKDLKAGDTGELDAILEAGTYLDVLFPRAVSQAALGVGMAWESMMRREELYARA